MTEPRGIRNNNPLNIRRGDPWMGLAKKQTDDAFCVFIHPKYCYRAATIILRHYAERADDTVAEIVREWAPANENDVAAYLKDVCERGEFSAAHVVDIHAPAELHRLLDAMTWHECGVSPFPYAIDQGIALAGAVHAPGT